MRPASGHGRPDLSSNDECGANDHGASARVYRLRAAVWAVGRGSPAPVNGPKGPSGHVAMTTHRMTGTAVTRASSPRARHRAMKLARRCYSRRTWLSSEPCRSSTTAGFDDWTTRALRRRVYEEVDRIARQTEKALGSERAMSPTTDGEAGGTLLDPLLRPEEVARILGVRRSSVYEYARTGRLPHVRVGRHVRFLREDIEEWIRQQRQL